MKGLVLNNIEICTAIMAVLLILPIFNVSRQKPEDVYIGYGMIFSVCVLGYFIEHPVWISGINVIGVLLGTAIILEHIKLQEKLLWWLVWILLMFYILNTLKINNIEPLRYVIFLGSNMVSIILAVLIYSIRVSRIKPYMKS